MTSNYAKRWENQCPRIADITKAIRDNRDWTVFLIKSSLHQYDTLDLIHDGSVPILERNAGPRDLRGITLVGEDFSNTSVLGETNFSGCQLNGVSFKNSAINGADFSRSVLDEVQFENAFLKSVRFNKAEIKRANLSSATLDHTCLHDALFTDPTFTGASAQNLEYNYEPPYGILLRLIGQRSGTRISYSSSLKLIDLSEEKRFDWNARELFREQERICRIEEQGKIFSTIYYMLTNYGRSFTRLFGWMVIMWIMFGFIYAGYDFPLDLSGVPIFSSFLESLRPEFEWHVASGSFTKWYDPYYFSVCTSVTLSFGDIRPLNGIAKVYSIIEAAMGVIMLGMFVSMTINYGGRSAR